MLTFRFLIPNTCIYKQLSTKSTIVDKANVIKKLNTENKYLYGNLVETQRERRKKANKAGALIKDGKSVTNGKSKVGNNKTDSEKSNKIISKEREKKKKIGKNIENSIFSECSLSSNDNISQDGHTHKLDSTVSNFESVENKDFKKVKTAKNHKNEILSSSVLVNENSVLDTSYQFIVSPIVCISEDTYPLENPEKLKLLSPNSPIEKVLNYGFSDSVIKHYMKFPSVSKIMEETMSDKNKSILSKWRKNMTDNLGEEGFHKHSEALKTRGQDFHTAVRNAVLNEPPGNYSEVTLNALKSLQWMLEHISNPMAVESIIAHPKLEYKGIPDCVAVFRNIPVLIDWKLSDKPKKDLKDTFEAPVQITAYIGALNHDPNYRLGVNHGLVAVAYTNGDPCDVFLLAPKHCQIYWRHWLTRFSKFKERGHLHMEHDIDENAL